jgi:hypothetical protein
MTRRAPAWTEERDVELRRLAERGYTVTRISIVMNRAAAFLRERAKALDIELKKPQRLPANERTYLGASRHSSGYHRRPQ